MKSPAQIAIEALDQVAREFELKWGVDRLPSLVAAFDPDLAARFWSQLEKLCAACETGAVDEQEIHATRMRSAWVRLDREAEAAGCEPLSPRWFEGTLPDGRLLVVAPDLQHAHRMANDNRQAVVWSMEEICRVLWQFEMVNEAKVVWPGARVEQTRVDPESTKPRIDWSKGDELPDGLKAWSAG
ncbi:MAG: hypothetical protein RL299_1365 [Pseudomonadota bacterium]|jgi:hypothetical protein